jgi:hypothetical protein
MILLDRSGSMNERTRGGRTLSEGAADAVNRLIFELAKRAQKEKGAPPVHYFDIGVFGYGQSALRADEAVETAFGHLYHGQPLVALPDLATRPLRVADVSMNEDLPSVRMPIWIEPVAGSSTPMCEAMATAGKHVAEWARDHPDSFPPIVMNITDGMVTDSPFQGADLAEWSNRLRTLQTSDGPALLFNLYLSPGGESTKFFPSTGEGLPAPGRVLFDLSSELPPYAVTAAHGKGFEIAPGARGLVFNAGMEALAHFLNIGTPTTKLMDDR